MPSKRKLIGFALVAAAIAGAFLSMITGLFPGLGGGTGLGNGTNSDNVEVNSAAETTDNETVPPAEKLASDGVLDIVIDDEAYLVKQSGGPRVKLTLDKIIELAPKMPGNADGKLVKVSLKRSSVFTAERELKEKLAAAGVTEEQIDWVEETVE